MMLSLADLLEKCYNDYYKLSTAEPVDFRKIWVKNHVA